MSKRPFVQYAIDLETNPVLMDISKINREEVLTYENLVSVCSICYAPISENPLIKTKYSVEKTELEVLKLPRGEYFFWNGSKFDCFFILPILIKNGYKKSEEKELKRGTYSYLIANGKFISLNYKTFSGAEIRIKDAYLLFSCSLKVFIDNTCPEFPKLIDTYDYMKTRITEADFSDSDKEYVKADIKGFAIGLARLRKDVFNEFKIDILEYFTAGSFAISYARENMNLCTRTNVNRELYTDIPKVDFSRKFIIGGRVELNSKYANTVIKNVKKLDIKSSYPNVMVNTKLPYGSQKHKKLTYKELREFLEKNPKYYVFAFPTSGKVWYNDMYSPIEVKSMYGCREYTNAHENGKPKKIMYDEGVYLDDNILRDEKFEASEDCIFNVIYFLGKVGIFDYMRNVYKLKNSYKLQERFALEFFVKIILNATFGKFIQKEEMFVYEYVDGAVKRLTDFDENGNEFYVKQTVKKWYNYAPLGAAILANARYILVKHMNLLQDRFIYCDTDSLVFTGEIPKEFDIGLELGQWEVENTDVDFIAFAKKTYAIRDKNKTGLVFCGISKKAFWDKYNHYAKVNPNNENEKYIDLPLEILKEDMNKDLSLSFDVNMGIKTKDGIAIFPVKKLKRYVENTPMSMI